MTDERKIKTISTYVCGKLYSNINNNYILFYLLLLLGTISFYKIVDYVYLQSAFARMLKLFEHSKLSTNSLVTCVNTRGITEIFEKSTTKYNNRLS